MTGILEEGCINPRRQVARVTKSCALAPNICRSLVWTFWRPDFEGGSWTFWQFVGPCPGHCNSRFDSQIYCFKWNHRINNHAQKCLPLILILSHIIQKTITTYLRSTLILSPSTRRSLKCSPSLLHIIITCKNVRPKSGADEKVGLGKGIERRFCSRGTDNICF